MNKHTNKNTMLDSQYIAPESQVINVCPELEILQTSGGTGGVVPDPEDGGDD